MNEQIKISGEVDSIVYKNEQNGYCVLMVNADNELITAVGEFGNIEEGEEVVIVGSYEMNTKYGKQFRAAFFERNLPTTSASIYRYLAGGGIKDIGPVLAKQIISKFGDESLEIIENQPEKLTEISGISLKKAKKFSKNFKQTFALRTLMVYFNKYQVATVYCIRAWKRWSDNALEVIKNNPYALCGYGIGLDFAKVDEIAEQEGFAKDSHERIKAGITYVLEINANEGHTCLPLDVLKKLTVEYFSISEELFSKVLKSELEEENLFSFYKNQRQFVMLKSYFAAENYIARRLEVMRQITYDNQIDFSDVIDLEEDNNNITYDEIQRKAINLALSKGFIVLTGGPGTGKTTTLNAIISLFEQQGLNVMIAAPTGRAAKRISDLTGYNAKTIHRLLEVQHNSDDSLTFVHNENNLLDCDALVVDEMSMVDSLLFEALLKAIGIGCKLVLVGDSNQLPSVGAGNVLKDIIDSGVMSVVTLEKIFRQAQQSDIVMNAHSIVEGRAIDLSKKDKDFFFMQRLQFEPLQSLVVELCKDRLPKAYGFSPIEDIQVLSPTRVGAGGTVELNKKLQEKLNPPMAGKSEIKTPQYTYRLGDKVMQTKNDYDILWKRQIDEDNTENGSGIFNGDIGIIIKVNKILKTVTIDFEGRIAQYSREMLDKIELAYAITVHKSQGSEFDAVILTLLGGSSKLYYRNLLYTAVTRAKKMLIIVGSKKCVDQMIQNNKRTSRYTALKNMLLEYSEEDKNENEQITLDI